MHGILLTSSLRSAVRSARRADPNGSGRPAGGMGVVESVGSVRSLSALGAAIVVFILFFEIVVEEGLLTRSETTRDATTDGGEAAIRQDVEDGNAKLSCAKASSSVHQNHLDWLGRNPDSAATDREDASQSPLPSPIHPVSPTCAADLCQMQRDVGPSPPGPAVDSAVPWAMSEARRLVPDSEASHKLVVLLGSSPYRVCLLACLILVLSPLPIWLPGYCTCTRLRDSGRPKLIHFHAYG